MCPQTSCKVEKEMLFRSDLCTFIAWKLGFALPTFHSAAKSASLLIASLFHLQTWQNTHEAVTRVNFSSRLLKP